MLWLETGYLWAQFIGTAEYWSAKTIGFTDIECSRLASAKFVEAVLLTEGTPSNIYSLDLAYKRGDPATIIVSQKFTATKQPFSLGITQTF